MKRLLTTTILALGIATPAWAENLALVIGNGAYKNATEAQTAVRDAKAVGEALSDAGWTVMAGNDLDREAMRNLIARFAGEVEDADKVVVFYSGHALRTGGRTYLAPIDTDATTLTGVLFDGVPLELLLRQAADRAGDAIVFIDGAQLRGFTPTEFVEPGLAALNPPDGVMIVSAAAPGRAVRRSRWRDSRFARLIVDQFLQPGAPVTQVAGNAPTPTFVIGKVDGDFMLADPPTAADDPNRLDAEIEITFWRAAESSGRREDYEAYLRRYPDGFFVELARQRLGIRDDGTREDDVPDVDPAVEAENALNLSRIRKRQVQEFLAALGFNPKGIDGIFGKGTRQALRKWQSERGHIANGFLTAGQLQQLRAEGTLAIQTARLEAERKRREAEAADNQHWARTGASGRPADLRAYLEKFPEGLHAAKARATLERIAEEKADRVTRRDRRTFRRAREADTAEAYRDYLGRFPNGIFRDKALARLDEIEGAERNQANRRRLLKIENALGLAPRDRISIEQRLRLLGYDVGPQDGRFDRRTRSAIRGYQNSRGLASTGFLNRATLVRLVRDTNRRRQGVVIDGADVIRGVLDALTK